MLLQLAVADAYGFCFEMAPKGFVAKFNTGKNYVQHPGRPHTPGNYSDDTQLSIGLAEFLLSKQSCTALNLARFFVTAFKRDPRAGYAGGFHALMTEISTPEEFLARVVSRSNRAGGAMRASPCGLLDDMYQVRDIAMWQASLTHGTKDGMDAAAAAALMVWACRQDCDPKYLAPFLNEEVPGYNWDEPWEGPVGNIGIEAVKAAVTALAASDSLSELLINSVAFTGDVDTVAAIAMSVASHIPDWKMTKDLNPKLYQGLESGPYGWGYLKKLDRDLEAAFPLNAPDPDPLPVPEEAVLEASDTGNLITDLFGS